MNILNWICQWYASNCDSDWEHEYGIKIYTLDNPGWSVNIDLVDTPLSDITVEFTRVALSETDWYDFRIEDGCYRGGGDPSKLSFLLEKFRELVEYHTAP